MEPFLQKLKKWLKKEIKNSSDLPNAQSVLHIDVHIDITMVAHITMVDHGTPADIGVTADRGVIAMADQELELGLVLVATTEVVAEVMVVEVAIKNLSIRLIF